MSGKTMLYKMTELLLAHVTDKIVCISKAEYASAIKNGIDDGKKLEIIENGVNVQAIRNTKAFDRAELGIPQNAFVMGMVGRVTFQKAPDIFIRAANIISKKIPNAYFIIVGSGEDEGEIKKYADKNNLHLIITGWTDKPYSYLKLFDVAVLLSRWEGFGLAIAEYMAAEKNFVATRVDATPTIVDDGIDGELVDVDSPQEVADKVMFYYTHPEEAKRMRESSKEKVMRKYDISRVVQQHKNMFSKLLL